MVQIAYVPSIVDLQDFTCRSPKDTVLLQLLTTVERHRYRGCPDDLACVRLYPFFIPLFLSAHPPYPPSIQSNLIIIATCVPSFRPFVKYLCDKRHRNPIPPPLQIPKPSEHYSGTSDLPSPVSARRMEPRPSGSVSHSLHPPEHRLSASRQKSVPEKPSKEKEEGVERQAFDRWRASEDEAWKASEAETLAEQRSVGVHVQREHGSERREGEDIFEPEAVAQRVLVAGSRPFSV